MNINHQGYSKELKFLKWELPIRQNEPSTSWDGGVGILEFAGGGVLELAPGIWECRFWGGWVHGCCEKTRHMKSWNVQFCHGRFSHQLRGHDAQTLNIAMRGLVKHETCYISFFRGICQYLHEWSLLESQRGTPAGCHLIFKKTPRGSHLQFGSFILWSWMVYIGANHAPWQHFRMLSNLFQPSVSRAWRSSGISSH